jgi:hypothetical protein
MSAGRELQAALRSALLAIPDLGGVFDGPPARAAFPYAIVDAASEFDWSHKTGEGREVLAAVTIWDDPGPRLAELADAAEAAMAAIMPCPAWRIVSFRLLRRTTLRDPAGPWATAIDYRARMLAT